MIPNNFCILPFIHFSMRTNGDMQLCCHTNSSGLGMPGCNRKDGNIISLANKDPKEYWNTPFYKDIRLKFLNNEIPDACKVCFKEEASNYKSKRIWETEEWSEKLEIDDIINSVEDDGSMPYNIKYIDMKLGNKCNLACIMCNPNDSSLMAKEYEKLGKEVPKDNFKWYQNNPEYWNSLYKNLHNLRSAYIIGGEPTINPEFKHFLEYCVSTGDSKHIKLRFNTNGHGKNKELFELYKEFEEVQIHLSIDGIEKYHEYIRYPSTWEKMLKILDEYSFINNEKNINVDIDCTVSLLNIEHIPDFIKWKVQNLPDINKVSFRGLIGLHLLHFPEHLSVKVLDKESKKRITQKYIELKEWLLINKSKKASEYPKLDAVVNYMNSEDKSDLNKSCKKYLNEMNKIRNYKEIFENN